MLLFNPNDYQQRQQYQIQLMSQIYVFVKNYDSQLCSGYQDITDTTLYKSRSLLLQF